MTDLDFDLVTHECDVKAEHVYDPRSALYIYVHGYLDAALKAAGHRGAYEVHRDMAGATMVIALLSERREFSRKITPEALHGIVKDAERRLFPGLPKFHGEPMNAAEAAWLMRPRWIIEKTAASYIVEWFLAELRRYL